MNLEKCYQCSVNIEISLDLKVSFSLVMCKSNNLIALCSTSQIIEISALWWLWLYSTNLVYFFCIFRFSMDRPSFEFQTFCFFCWEECIVDMDPKHSDRFEQNPGVMCKTAHRGKSKDGKQRKWFKEVIEEVRMYIIYQYFKKQKLSIKSGSRKKRRKVLWQFFYHLCFIDMQWTRRYTSW